MGVLSIFSLLTMRIDAIVASPFRATTRAKKFSRRQNDENIFVTVAELKIKSYFKGAFKSIKY